jgi:hypothetical protein
MRNYHATVIPVIEQTASFRELCQYQFINWLVCQMLAFSAWEPRSSRTLCSAALCLQAAHQIFRSSRGRYRRTSPSSGDERRRQRVVTRQRSAQYSNLKCLNAAGPTRKLCRIYFSLRPLAMEQVSLSCAYCVTAIIKRCPTARARLRRGAKFLRCCTRKCT